VGGVGGSYSACIAWRPSFTDFSGSGIVQWLVWPSAALAGVLVLVRARKGKYGPNGEVRGHSWWLTYLLCDHWVTLSFGWAVRFSTVVLF